MSKLRRPNSKSTLHVIASLLLASAVLRLATEAGPAVAQAPEQGMREQAAEILESADPEETFLAALQAREIALNEREMRIDAKAEALTAANAELEEQLIALRSAEASLQATIAAAETASETDVAQLTSVYENMKPKEAAALFEEMSPEFAAGFLGLMRPDIAAAIMTQLAPETAHSFSVVLAGRNAETPTE